MKLDDVILVGSTSAALYLGYQWLRSRQVPAGAIYVNNNRASPFAAPGRPFLNPLPAPTINNRLPNYNVLKNPPGYTWNDEAESYVKKDSENSLDMLYV